MSVIELTKALISVPSVTPEDLGCQQILIDRLSALGFNIEKMTFGPVCNFWARLGDQQPLFTFAGHTDVVPAGDLTQWNTLPFEPTVKDGYLYGRGAADMKGSLAAMVCAVEKLLSDSPPLQGSIGFLITGDEEGIATDGTVKVIERLQDRGEHIDYCLVGEPSSTEDVGDVIKNGRRGSLSGQLTVVGQQGHVAYPHLADNPIHRAAPALAALTAVEWDQGNEFFPPTSFQISNIHAGTGANNVIPHDCIVDFNFRFSTESTVDDLIQQTHQILSNHSLRYDIRWHVSGQPFLTAEGSLVQATVDAIEQVSGRVTQLSTAGGTSDGRFIAPTGAQVVELGPVNATIHQVNECVRVTDLYTLTDQYHAILKQLLVA